VPLDSTFKHFKLYQVLDFVKKFEFDHDEESDPELLSKSDLDPELPLKSDLYPELNVKSDPDPKNLLGSDTLDLTNRYLNFLQIISQLSLVPWP